MVLLYIYDIYKEKRIFRASLEAVSVAVHCAVAVAVSLQGEARCN